MNKIFVLLIGLVITGVVGYTAYSLSSAESEQSTNSETKAETPTSQIPTTQNKEVDNKSTLKPTTPGAYVDYSDTAITKASGTRLLFFHAPWCSQCRAIESDIKEQGVPSNATVIKVDYDSNQDLRKKYNVTLQTTFVKVDKDGNEIEKYIAYDQPTFDSVKTNLL